MKLQHIHNRALFYSALCIILASGAGLRITAAQNKPFWIDEAWTLYFARTYSYQQLLFTAPITNDVHPGLYYAVVKSLLPSISSVETLRIVSSVLPQTIAFMLFVAWAIYRKLPQLTILLIAIALSFSPFLIHYGWQLRMYSLMILWTSIISIVTADFLFYRSSWLSLYALLPFIGLANITDINGYILAATAWLMIALTHQGVKRVKIERLGLWTACFFILIFISLMPYRPFQTAQSFSRASWLLSPTPIYALRAYPLTVLGLDTALSPENSGGIWHLGIVMGIMSMLGGILFWVTSRVPKKILPVWRMLIAILVLIPMGGYVFSQTSRFAAQVPLIHRFIPPISVFLPRFFAPQALLLHVGLGISLSYCIKKGSLLMKIATITTLIMITIVWLHTNQILNNTSVSEKRTTDNTQQALKSAAGYNSVFYPGYTALMLLYPTYQVSPDSISRTFSTSNAFEEAIKTPDRESPCGTLTQYVGPVKLYESINIPSFFSPYSSRLSQFKDQFCIPTANNGGNIIVYTCQCPHKPQ